MNQDGDSSPAIALKGRNLNSLAFQRQAGEPPPTPSRPEGAVLFLAIAGFRPFRAGMGEGCPPGAKAPGYSNCAPSGRPTQSRQTCAGPPPGLLESVPTLAAPVRIDRAPCIQARRSQTSRQTAPAGIESAPRIRACRSRGPTPYNATAAGINRAPLLGQRPRHVTPELKEGLGHGIRHPRRGRGSGGCPMPGGEGRHREEQGEGRGEEDLREDRTKRRNES